MPLANTDIAECKSYPEGTALKFKKVEGGISVQLLPGVKVVEMNYPNVDRQALEAFVREMCDKYPQVTLQDIYKSNFQDYFGPSHIMADRENVIAYINRELQMLMKERSEAAGKEPGAAAGNWYDPCGWRHNYYQVSLDVVADGIMSADEFADAFMAGGGKVPEVTQEWLDEWNEIKRAAKRAVPGMKGFSKDAAKISSLIKDGKYVVHHSEVYNKAYKPHYRIIRKDIFEAIVLPKIIEYQKNAEIVH